MKANYITPPQKCTGCALCSNVCSTNAVRMLWNENGFLVPDVNTDACINCGACVRACPAQPIHLEELRNTARVDAPLGAYGAWNHERKTHIQSSSGGIFTALATLIFEQGGCVFGVIWETPDTAIFSKAESLEELAAMRGSKYTQAQPGMVYRQVKEELKKGRKVLFCGTSCQVYALQRFLKKKHENLILVDILCHGVPSRLLLQSYIQSFERETGKNIRQIHFREKKGNWQNYQIRKLYSDGTWEDHRNGEDMFLRIFVGDFVLNEACYNCPHTRLPRVGDITLGDFWGDLQSSHPEWPISDGIGSVLANTQRGQTILHVLEEKAMIQLEPVPFEELLKGQRSTYLRQTPTIPAERLKVLNMLRTQPLKPIFKRLILTVKIAGFRIKRHGLIHKIIRKLRSFIR